MKKLATCILFFLFAVMILPLKATHNRAGEILYKRIPPFTSFTYSITVIKYTDHGAGIADRCVDTVYFGDGSRGVANRINGLSSGCGCGTGVPCGSVIVNYSQPKYVVNHSIYSITHTYGGPGSYLIRSFDPNRNQGVHNIPNSVNLPFYIESLLIINSFSGMNSSPTLTNPPVDFAWLGTCFNHNMGAVEPDGDSLSYEITACRGINGASVSGYFFPETGTNGNYSINPVTGVLSWCTPQFVGEYNIALIVKEWRKNTSGQPTMIGYVLRDMQVLVRAGVVALSEYERDQNLDFYPNPSDNYLRLSSDARIIITDMSGRTVMETEGQAGVDISLVDLREGVYIVKLSTGSRKVMKKLVVRN